MTPSKARRQGREMYYPGEDPAMLNPYHANHHHHQDFLDGWNEAKLKQESADREAEMLNGMDIATEHTALLERHRLLVARLKAALEEEE